MLHVCSMLCRYAGVLYGSSVSFGFCSWSWASCKIFPLVQLVDVPNLVIFIIQDIEVELVPVPHVIVPGITVIDQKSVVVLVLMGLLFLFPLHPLLRSWRCGACCWDWFCYHLCPQRLMCGISACLWELQQTVESTTPALEFWWSFHCVTHVGGF